MRFKELKNVAYALIITATLSSPVVYMAVSRFMTISNQAVTYGVLGIALIPETIFRFSGWNWSVAGMFIITLIIGLTYLYVKNKQMLLFSLMFMILPVIISVILSSKMTMNPRYLIYLLPVIFATVACCYALLEIIATDKRVVYVIIAIIIVTNALPLMTYYSNQTSEDWRGYSARLSQTTNAGDIVVAVPGYISTPLNYYYNNKTDGTLMMYADSVGDVETALTQKTTNNVYFVVTGDLNAVNPQGDVLQLLDKKTVALGQYSGIYTFSAKI
jgi:archaellum component FlaG (FlaF/FlaG flagellin family)